MKSFTGLTRPTVGHVKGDGDPRLLLSTEDAKRLYGYSVEHLRDRANVNRQGKRGAFIRSYKIGKSIYFHPDELREDIFVGGRRAAPLQPRADDCSWL